MAGSGSVVAPHSDAEYSGNRRLGGQRYGLRSTTHPSLTVTKNCEKLVSSEPELVKHESQKAFSIKRIAYADPDIPKEESRYTLMGDIEETFTHLTE